MRLLQPIEWLGRQGTRAIAASIFLGMALPPVSAVAKPLLPYSIFVLLALAMVRIDTVELAAIGRRPGRLALCLLWVMLGVPAIFGTLLIASGLLATAPDVALAVVLMLAAPPIMSVPAFCAILGLNATLSLVVMVLALVATPVVAPVIGSMLVGEALPLAPIAMAERLAVFVIGSALVATLIRKLAGVERVRDARHLLDGVNVVLLFIFAVALMDGVAARAFAEPILVLGLVALSFLVAGGIIAATTIAFLHFGRRDALSLALTAGNRNMGLMASALIAGLPDLAWVYFAMAQFPIYLLLPIMRPIIERLGVVPPATGPHP